MMDHVEPPTSNQTWYDVPHGSPETSPNFRYRITWILRYQTKPGMMYHMDPLKPNQTWDNGRRGCSHFSATKPNLG